ncbi:hypothetical protein [Ottowia thiooxydans]|uniref:hypothetical protein n=1 Tax=Ottowia thiooxydans TaxID=219182 RepID=UPI00048F9B9F|nr:hypothetical protein [Ottowia thiooxydans]
MKSSFLACGALLCSLSALTHAAPLKDPTSGCGVVAQRYLGSNDYIFHYQGGCKDGLAQGAGKATWTLRYAPSAKPVVWEGQFDHGVYLPPPKGVVRAREWQPERGSGTVLFDLGPLPALAGIAAARVQVEATSSLTDFPEPCMPRRLWVTNAPTAAMASDDVAKALLLSAGDKLKAHCSNAVRQTGKREVERPLVEVRAVSTPELESDQYGNPGSVVASAFAPMQAGAAIERYSNQAASQQRAQQQRAQDSGDRQANLQKLQAFFKAHQAQGWAHLGDIAQNPFRYADRVVVTAVYLNEVLSPTRALVEARVGSYGRADVVIDATAAQGISQWTAGPRLVAVRVKGRIEEENLKGLARLQLVGSEACTQRDCSDRLRLPSPLQDGQTP